VQAYINRRCYISPERSRKKKTDLNLTAPQIMATSSSTEARLVLPPYVRRYHRRVRDARSASKTASSQGSVMAASWSKPNSSSAIRSRTRNSGCWRQAMGTTKRHRLSPTYTGKWPLGTLTSCCRRPRLEHRRRICFRLAACAIFFAIACLFCLLC
jgi:hypothetical protein